MPRIKPLIRQDPREKEMLQTLGAAQAATGKSYKEICERAGIQYNAFMLHKRNPKQMRHGEYWRFLDTCARLTG